MSLTPVDQSSPSVQFLRSVFPTTIDNPVDVNHQREAAAALARAGRLNSPDVERLRKAVRDYKRYLDPSTVSKLNEIVGSSLGVSSSAEAQLKIYGEFLRQLGVATSVSDELSAYLNSAKQDISPVASRILERISVLKEVLTTLLDQGRKILTPEAFPRGLWAPEMPFDDRVRVAINALDNAAENMRESTPDISGVLLAMGHLKASLRGLT